MLNCSGLFWCLKMDTLKEVFFSSISLHRRECLCEHDNCSTQHQSILHCLEPICLRIYVCVSVRTCEDHWERYHSSFPLTLKTSQPLMTLYKADTEAFNHTSHPATLKISCWIWLRGESLGRKETIFSNSINRYPGFWFVFYQNAKDWTFVYTGTAFVSYPGIWDQVDLSYPDRKTRHIYLGNCTQLSLCQVENMIWCTVVPPSSLAHHFYFLYLLDLLRLQKDSICLMHKLKKKQHQTETQLKQHNCPDKTAAMKFKETVAPQRL